MEDYFKMSILRTLRPFAKIMIVAPYYKNKKIFYIKNYCSKIEPMLNTLMYLLSKTYAIYKILMFDKPFYRE